MKLVKMKLSNFRGFYGETPWFHFSQGEENNVTVIHCENGVGKTTLLNAFTWCLYEQLTDDVQEPNELVNKKVLRNSEVGNVVECWVEIHFEHLRKKYRIKKNKKVKKVEHPHGWVKIGNPEIVMHAVGDDGTWEEVKNAMNEIGRILPERLHNYFFFNGERIEWIQRPINRRQFIDAVTMLVGDETYVRANRHLNSAKQRLEKEQQLLGDAETAHLYEEKGGLEEDLAKLEQQIEVIEKNISGLNDEFEVVSTRLLAEGGDVSGLEEKRQRLMTELESIGERIKDNRREIVDTISENGYQVFASAPVKMFLSIINQLRESGQIPSPYKATFVKHLLDHKTCICDRPLIEGEDPYNTVLGWLNRAAMSDVEDIALRMEGVIEEIARSIPKTIKSLDQMQNARVEYFDERADLHDELLDISETLKSSPLEKVRELENRLDEITDMKEQLIFRHGEVSQKRKTKLAEISKKEDEISKKEAVSEKERLVKEQIRACLAAITDVELRRNEMRNLYRHDLENRINKIFNEITFKPYQVKLAEDYSLSVIGTDGTVGKSTSESQVLSLSFICALIEQTREFIAKRDLIGVNSSVYPLVMDSPFGNLGEAYQEKVSEVIPTLASQVVIMVSNSQWKGDVERSIAKYVGKQYVISYYTPKSSAREVELQINGENYPLVKRSATEEEYIIVREVTR